MVYDLLQMVDFCLHLCKCGVHIFVYEEHGGSMIVTRFTNYGGYRSLVVSFKRRNG